ncbi:Scr1 family TA system antitoxin-like transcriptional regulator [Actinomadura viridis]|uniref:helix-turn-helix domain-containing protein n=1 Tax=Actinomadura viridis TaxID=58110 RepID=UPI0036BB1B1F
MTLGTESLAGRNLTIEVNARKQAGCRPLQKGAPMASRKPTPRTVAFGTEVIRLRKEAGLTRQELARRVHVSRSYIGQVETGTTRCREDFAQRLDEGLGTGTTVTDLWDDLLRSSGYPTWFADYPRAEETAKLLRAYEVMYVYGLFQTEAYMRALLQKESDVEGRLRRQAVLKREDPPMISVVLSETTLWTCLGGPEVMREQCEHLLALSQEENVTLQVATAFQRGLDGSFHLATQPNGEDLLYMPAAKGGITTNDRQDILHIVSAFSALQAHALSADDSREFLRKAVVRWT